MTAFDSHPLDVRHELAAEAIAVRVRWFGVCLGLIFVNGLGRDIDAAVLNLILLLGAAYTLIDTLSSRRGRVLLTRWPLAISLLESVFIGLLCFFDTGLESPFRFYYVLSLVVCAMRHSRTTTWLTFGFHCVSYTSLFLLLVSSGVVPAEGWVNLVLTGTVLAWVTWTSLATTSLVNSVSERLAEANRSLLDNKVSLEERIAERTRELRDSQAMLVQQEKQAAFGLLAAGIAHEVGNPLAGISSLVQMLNRSELDEASRRRLGLVEQQLTRIQGILRELVDFSRPAPPIESRCHLQEVIDDALGIAKYYRGKKGKQIITDLAGDLPRLRVMRDRLVQVCLNLVLNAMDATSEGGTIIITASSETDFLRLRIRDDGIGISPDNRYRLFQPYFTTKQTGTGLGLFVCRMILEEMGGEIRLVETGPEGTTFEVRLPNALFLREMPLSESDSALDRPPASSSLNE